MHKNWSAHDAEPAGSEGLSVPGEREGAEQRAEHTPYFSHR